MATMSATLPLLATGRTGLGKALAELTKVRISAMSSLTAAVGYVAFARRMDWGILTASLGTVLLAMGASALNEWQEREYDALMVRTRNRPLPTGFFSPAVALIAALCLGAAGLLLLLAMHGGTAALLGLLAMVWYNGVYTPLKRVTAFAALPGSLIGAIPPAIGWAAAGGSVGEPAILAIGFVFFIWQVPHFWLLLLMYGEDYERAGFPTLTRRFGETRLTRLTFTWMGATAASCALLSLFSGILSWPSLALLVASAAWLVWKASALLRIQEGPMPFRRAFHQINLFALLLMLSVVLDPLFVR
jgi:protoheme IX farnesyltransferase